MAQNRDQYQERYLEHQQRKRLDITSPSALFAAMRTRRSQRTFTDETITGVELGHIYEAIRLAPSSCNRQAIVILPASEADEKQELERLLVGGRDWLAGASTILLFFADLVAYKAPGEQAYMPYLDAGFAGENIYLAAEALGIGACYVNPNIRAKDKAQFDELFNPRGLLFCGAMALGKYDIRATEPPKRRLTEVFYG